MVGHQRGAAKLFQQIKHHTRQRQRGLHAKVQRAVAVTQAQRHAVGRASKRARIIGLCLRMQMGRKTRQSVVCAVQQATPKMQLRLSA